MQVAGVAWMRNRKLEIAEQPVDAEDVGMQHVRQEKISTLHLDWVACLVEEARMQSAAPGSANADKYSAAAKALRGDAYGGIEDVPKTLQSQLGVEAVSFSTFRKWERESFRQRKVIAAAASHSILPHLAISSCRLDKSNRLPAPVIAAVQHVRGTVVWAVVRFRVVVRVVVSVRVQRWNRKKARRQLTARAC